MDQTLPMVPFPGGEGLLLEQGREDQQRVRLEPSNGGGLVGGTPQCRYQRGRGVGVEHRPEEAILEPLQFGFVDAPKRGRGIGMPDEPVGFRRPGIQCCQRFIHLNFFPASLLRAADVLAAKQKTHIRLADVGRKTVRKTLLRNDLHTARCAGGMPAAREGALLLPTLGYRNQVGGESVHLTPHLDRFGWSLSNDQIGKLRLEPRFLIGPWEVSVDVGEGI